MAGLDENCLKDLNSSQILKQEFLRCGSKEDVSKEQKVIQKIFLKKTSINASEPTYVNNQPIYETIDELHTQALYSEPVSSVLTYVNNQPIYETIDELHTQALYSEPVYSEPVSSEPTYVNNQSIYETLHCQKSDIIAFQQKIESIVSEKSVLTIEGSFKKRDVKNIQKIKEMTQSFTKYNPDDFSFDLYSNMILNLFKGLKSSSSKLAAFLYVLDSTKDKEDSKIQINNKKIYKELPRKYKKLIKKSNPKFSINMRSPESLKSIDSIRAHLQKRSIFIKAQALPLKDRI
ncbi:MAG: hypothetical protein WAJ84_02505 [Candidatus Rhabdochlamydia sp.]|jgi:hypothetical protein